MMGNLVEGLDNSFSLGVNSYPCGLENKTNIIINYMKCVDNPNHPGRKKSTIIERLGERIRQKYNLFKMNIPTSSDTVVVRWEIYLQTFPAISKKDVAMLNQQNISQHHQKQQQHQHYLLL